MNCKINFFGSDRKPIIAVVGCLHGNELVGRKIISRLRKIKLKKGTLITIIANEKAIKQKKRFIDQDLNRSFPGKKNGNYEEVLAYNILKIAKKADFILDIHSTTTDVKDLAIITKTKKAVLDLAYAINPRRIALMKKDIAGKSLIDHCKTAVSLEYGKDKNSSTYNNTLNSIVSFLEKEEMVNIEKIKSNKRKVDLYKITGVVKRAKEDVLKKNIRNFKLIKRGETFAMRNKKNITAKENFYPIIFGENAYGNIFGFKAVKKTK